MHRSRVSRTWALVRMQHGVVARWQLLELGWSAAEIAHRVATRRLHPLYRGVYAVGRPDVSREGTLMAAVLACGPAAVLSHAGAAELWGIDSRRHAEIDVSVLQSAVRRRSGIVLHRRTCLAPDETTLESGIPVTRPARTLVDLATRLSPGALEAAINEADKVGLIDPEKLREALDGFTGQPGAGRLRRLLDRRTFTLTDSELERLFLPITRQAGMTLPLTRQRVNGFKVDFYWPDLGLVVETDGLRYHRTAASQTLDRRRDQAHTAAGLTALRFTHAQIKFEPRCVEATLATVARRLARRITSGS